MIKSAQDYCMEIGAKQETEEAAQHLWKRNIYKYTDCGACIEFHEDGVTIGSIVEGSDVDCTPIELKYPFSLKQYDEAIEKIEEEASILWDEANGDADE